MNEDTNFIGDLLGYEHDFDDWSEDSEESHPVSEPEPVREPDTEPDNAPDNRWDLVKPTLANTFFTIDQAKSSAWTMAKRELTCVEDSLRRLLGAPMLDM